MPGVLCLAGICSVVGSCGSVVFFCFRFGRWTALSPSPSPCTRLAFCSHRPGELSLFSAARSARYPSRERAILPKNFVTDESHLFEATADVRDNSWARGLVGAGAFVGGTLVV